MKKRSSLLDRLYLQNPCQTDWESMPGDERARFCGECDKHVHNLSALTRRQAEDLIVRSGGRLCAKVERDEQGRIITADPAGGAAKLRLPSPRLASAALVTLLGLGGGQPQAAQAAGRAVTTRPMSSPERGRQEGQAPAGACQLSGKVYDAAGDVIEEGADVALMTEDRRRVRLVRTTDAGEYCFAGVNPGRYYLEVTARGFSTYKTKVFGLKAGEQRSTDVTLQVGSVGGMALLPGWGGFEGRPDGISRHLRAIKKFLRIES